MGRLASLLISSILPDINEAGGGGRKGMETSGHEERSDEWYAAELSSLQREREKLLADAGRKSSSIFNQLDRHVKRRMKIAADYRDLQLRNVFNHYKIDVQQAWNEFERGKKRLQSSILDISTERRRRLHPPTAGSTGTSGSAAGAHYPFASASFSKKRRRHHHHHHYHHHHQSRQQQRVMMMMMMKGSPLDPFVASLEGQGLVRVALTPDEVNADLAGILRGTDSARTNGSTVLPLVMGNASGGPGGSPSGGALPPSQPPSASGMVAKHAEKVHSSRGTLHYHDTTYEKGDQVAIYSNAQPKPTLRYKGTVTSINSKEITIHSDIGKSFLIIFIHPSIHPRSHLPHNSVFLFIFKFSCARIML